MNKLIKKISAELEIQAMNLESKFPSKVVYDQTALSKIDIYLKENHKFIKETVMKKDVNYLDRHKIAALIMCSIVSAKPITVLVDDEEVSFANEKLAFSMGMSYLKKWLIETLENQNNAADAAKLRHQKFILPKALSCQTEYPIIMCRDLFYANKYYKLNPITLANTLFLLEYITLIKLDIHIRPEYEERTLSQT